MLAHEGHSHAPAEIQAPHGGIIKPTDQLYLELVHDASSIKLFPLTHELKPIDLSKLKISATVQVPKKEKKPLSLTASEDHYATHIDFKDAHRYTLEVALHYKGKKQKLSFLVERE